MSGIRIENNETGVSIWLNDKWIMDASTFKDSYEITIDAEKFKKSKSDKDLIFTLKDKYIK